MKKSMHPAYRDVVIKDAASGLTILTRSTQTSDETIVWTDGKSYPLVTVEVSSASHPHFTGKDKPLDAAGQIERFRRRYGK